MAITMLTVEDMLSYKSGITNNKKAITDSILPFIILPSLMILSTMSRTVTIIVMVAIGMAVLYVYSRPRQKNRSPFFFSWTLSSGIYLFLVFEFRVLKPLVITREENFVLLVLVACTCYFFNKMKAVFAHATGSSKGKEYSPVLTSDSHYCQICQIEVNERFFHSIWWNCCVLRPNYPYFLAGQVFAFAALLFGTNLGLTTVCQPFILIGTILLPEDCSDVYYQMGLQAYRLIVQQEALEEEDMEWHYSDPETTQRTHFVWTNVKFEPEFGHCICILCVWSGICACHCFSIASSALRIHTKIYRTTVAETS